MKILKWKISKTDIRLKNIPSLVILIFSFFITSNINYLFYNSLDSPDFTKYSVYFNYLFSDIDKTSREQGVLYYLVHSYNLFFNNSQINDTNASYLLNKHIQDVNNLFFLIGLIGIYKLLMSMGFKKKNVLYTLTLTNFLPISIATRIILKPEIIVFAFLPWVFYFIEQFFITKKNKFLYYAIPSLVICVTSKSSLAAMTFFFIFIVYFKKLSALDLKKIVIPILLFSMIFFAVSFENYNLNTLNIINFTPDEKYENIADIEMLWNLDFEELFNSPFKYMDSNSLSAFLFLDTFGDYFDIYWSNDSQYFSYGTLAIIEYEKDNSRISPSIDASSKKITLYQSFSEDPAYKNSGRYSRAVLGIFCTIIFYLFLLKRISTKEENYKFLLGPIVGIFVLLFVSITGIPIKNWDPNTMDTLKSVYYSPLFVISFCILLCVYFSKNSFNYLLTFPIVLIFLYLIGFPKTYDLELLSWIANSNEFSPFCKFNNLYYQISDFVSGVCSGKLQYPVTPRFQVPEFVDLVKQPKLLIYNLSIIILALGSIILNFYKKIEVSN
jgi:hypothetical protein